MNKDRIAKNKFMNFFLTGSLILGMALLMLALGYLFLGIPGLIWAGILGVFALFMNQYVPSKLIMRMQKARPLGAHEAPKLTQIIRELAKRAQLHKVPQLYYVPSQAMNAFATGSKNDPAIALTYGLIQRLNLRELAGVLAHEISHITNNDIQLQRIAAFIQRTTRVFSFVGKVLLFINLPLLLMGEVAIPWLAILLLLLAPLLSTLMMLAISRTREFEADLEAARLTGDPSGLASALERLNYFNEHAVQRLLSPIQKWVIPEILRTHPTTKARVEQLKSLVPPKENPLFSNPNPDMAFSPNRPTFLFFQ